MHNGKIYQAYSLANYMQIPQMHGVSESEKFSIRAVGSILPFKTNNYVINELIDWSKVPDDPIYTLTFPKRAMLDPKDFFEVSSAILKDVSREELKLKANSIRTRLNPHPAGQVEFNVPKIDGVKLTGMQHKYRETVLFFPSHGQTCHAYCTFCFRWPQFVGMDEMKFSMRESELLVRYVQEHTEVTDVLFTGGDPLVMKTKILTNYFDPLLDARIENLQTIRIGTKALGYWPYRFTDDEDADDLLRLFERIVKSGRNLALMAHFNHPVELSTTAVKNAITRIRNTGAQIRTQSPVLRHINDDSETWAEMWRKQVNLNCIPYYMFIPRDTGAQHYFSLPLVEAWDIFRKAYQKVSGVCRTVRGPSMSCNPGKIQVLGVSEVFGKKVLVMRMLQGRNPDWVARPFFAEYDENAIWLDELKPAFGESNFFFEGEMNKMFQESPVTSQALNFE